MVTSKFKEKRDGIFHSGVDIIGQKLTPVASVWDGVVFFKGYHTEYGNFVILKHNLSYINIQAVIYSLYGHLHTVTANGFVKKGQAVGKMGNSGNCLTKVGGKWRALTREEQEDENNQRGVHLHLEVYMIDDESVKSLKKKVKIKDTLRQWGRIYVDPFETIAQLEKVWR